jgi:hypothetical protein
MAVGDVYEKLRSPHRAFLVTTGAEERLRHRTKKAPCAGAFNGADARTRTGDPFITSEVLYQLSYVGVASYCSPLRP